MRYFHCPRCGFIPSEKSDRTTLVQCTECGEVMTEAHMLENLPPPPRGESKKRGPEFILKGKDWPGKEIKNADKS